MTNEQLIAKAKEHAATFERAFPFGGRVSDFEKATIRDAVVIRFDSEFRDDHITVCLDKVSGEFISAEYSPPTIL